MGSRCRCLGKAIAATDRSLIKRISEMAQRDEVNGAEMVARSVPPPWKDFREHIRAQLDQIIVSHRADHGRIDQNARRWANRPKRT